MIRRTTVFPLHLTNDERIALIYRQELSSQHVRHGLLRQVNGVIIIPKMALKIRWKRLKVFRY
jgi:hypothetical protein